MNLWRRMFGPRRPVPRGGQEKHPSATTPPPVSRRAYGHGFTAIPYDPMKLPPGPGPVGRLPSGRGGAGPLKPPPKNPSPTATRRVFAAGALKGVEVYVHAAHSFWTGDEAKRNLDHARGAGRRELVIDKILRLVQGNGHMLSAIYHMLDATIPSEIECPNCLATIRAPYADDLKR